jgi:hypothetical protein
MIINTETCLCSICFDGTPTAELSIEKSSSINQARHEINIESLSSECACEFSVGMTRPIGFHWFLSV